MENKNEPPKASRQKKILTNEIQTGVSFSFKTMDDRRDWKKAFKKKKKGGGKKHCKAKTLYSAKVFILYDGHIIYNSWTPLGSY